MKIIQILFLFIFLSPSLAADSPNVLFILTDNQAASLLGTYGNPDIKTPHIDKLARDGIKFTRAFAVNGMCSATRNGNLCVYGTNGWQASALCPQRWC